MPKKSEGLTPKDIGMITKETKSDYQKSLGLLGHQENLTGLVVELDDKIGGLDEKIIGQSVVKYFNEQLGELGEELKQAMSAVDEAVGDDEELKTGLSDLQTLETLEDEDLADGCNLFFGDEDKERAGENIKQASGLLEGMPESLWQGVKYRWEKRKQAAKVEKSLVELRSDSQQRDDQLQRASQLICDKLNSDELMRLTGRFMELDFLLNTASMINSALSQSETDGKITPLQKTKARSCKLALQRSINNKNRERIKELNDKLTNSYRELETVLNVEDRIQDSKTDIEELKVNMEEKMAKASAEQRGIMELLSTLPASQTTQEQIGNLNEQIRRAAGRVTEKYQEAMARLEEVEAKLEQGEASPVAVEGLLTTLENGNPEELYFTNFNKAMEELNEHIRELKRLLNIREERPALPAHEQGVLEAYREDEEGFEAPSFYAEAKELFAENFYGISEIEQAFALQYNREKLINLTPEQKQAAIQELENFLKEPDVKQFIEKLKNKEIDSSQWQLRLQVGKFADGIDFTMENFNTKVAKDMDKQGQGKLLYSVDDSDCWYTKKGGQDFYKKDKLKLSWVISTNEVVPNTLNKKQDQQTEILRGLAQQVGLNFDEQASRSHPTEILLRSFLAIRNGKRILENKWDRSFTKDSAGIFVDVGYCDADGAGVGRWGSGGAYPSLGASFSRRSGQVVT